MSSMTKGAQPLLQARGLSKYFPLESGLLASLRGAKAAVKAVESVSLDVYAGQTLAIVGESGSGKSTLGRLLLRLLQPTTGQVLYNGAKHLRHAADRIARLPPASPDHSARPLCFPQSTYAHRQHHP